MQIALIIIFISFKDDNDEKLLMHSKSDNKKIMINYKTDEGMEELYKSIVNRY